MYNYEKNVLPSPRAGSSDINLIWTEIETEIAVHLEVGVGHGRVRFHTRGINAEIEAS